MACLSFSNFWNLEYMHHLIICYYNYMYQAVPKCHCHITISISLGPISAWCRFSRLLQVDWTCSSPVCWELFGWPSWPPQCSCTGFAIPHLSPSLFYGISELTWCSFHGDGRGMITNRTNASPFIPWFRSSMLSFSPYSIVQIKSHWQKPNPRDGENIHSLPSDLHTDIFMEGAGNSCINGHKHREGWAVRDRSVVNLCPRNLNHKYIKTFGFLCKEKHTSCGINNSLKIELIL